MNRSGWKNMSFPVWFSPKLIDSLGIDRVVLEFTNFNFTDTSLTVSDTLPYQKILIDFRPKGEVQKVVMKEMSSGVEIGEMEEHTSELQSRPHLVCRLLLEKKNA